MKSSGSVGVRELKENPSKYLRMARDENMELDIAIRGEVVARLVPVRRDVDQAEIDAALERHRQLAEEISNFWPDGVSAIEAIREQRRELWPLSTRACG